MLAKKLLVRAGSRVAVIGAPSTIDLVLPPEAKPSERGPADIVLAYAQERGALDGVLAKATKRVVDGGILWIAYPKAGKLGTDLNRDILARALRAVGLEPVAQIALDDVWSALRVKRDAALTAARTARGVFAERPAKKAAAKKPAAKKTATKKPAAKKTATKKPAARTAAKRPAAKKAAAKRPAAKKAAAKRPAAKKAAKRK